MITLDGPQIWTIIGVLSATIVGMVTFGFTMILRVIRVEIGGLRSEVRGEIGSLRTELNGSIGTLRTEVQVRLDQVDRDINAIMKHLFGIDRE